MAAVSRSVGRYLCAIHVLSMQASGAAKTGELADQLSVSAASVTEMCATLESRDLAAYEKYRGVELTAEGEAIASELLWKRCLAENFLSRDLDVEDDGVRELGHAFSDDVAHRLKAYIDHPCDGLCNAPSAEYDECTIDASGER